MNIERIQAQFDALTTAFNIVKSGGRLLHPRWGAIDLIGVPSADLEMLIVWIEMNKK